MTIFFPHTSQAFLSIAVVLSQSGVARTSECNKAPYKVAYGIEICSHLQVGHVVRGDSSSAGACSPSQHSLRVAGAAYHPQPGVYYCPFGDSVSLINKFRLTL